MIRLVAMACLAFWVLVHPSSGQDLAVQLKIDCSQSPGTIPPYVFGVPGGPFYDPQGLALAKEAGFRLIETVSYMGARVPGREAPPPGPPGFGPPLPGMGSPPPRGQPPSGVKGQGNLPQTRQPNSQQEVKSQLEECFRLGLEVMPFCALYEPPPDSKIFQEQVRHSVKEMQKMAQRHGTRIKLFRFGNEPELRQFWRGTSTQFFQTYALWVKALKSVEPQAIVVAGGFASPYPIPEPPDRTPTSIRAGADTPVISSVLQDFVKYCHQNGLPLDVLAFHGYGVDPYKTFGLPLELVGNFLKNYPRLSPAFGVPKLAINEWNQPLEFPPKIYNPTFDTAWVAAHNTATLMEMIQRGLYISVRFGGTTVGPAEQNMPEPDFILVTKDHGKKPSYYALAGINRFAHYPQQVTATSANRNFEVLAGLSPRKDALYMAVCHFPIFQYIQTVPRNPYVDLEEKPGLQKIAPQHPDTPRYALQIQQLPFAPGGKVRLRRYRVDDSHQGQVVEDKQLNAAGRLDLSGHLPGPGVDFILLEAVH